ncbi:hypothetical protein OPT61_g4894 [Boeremia exigua]|uniref:Uncharacterized protein n=1 Tax=Boeremia exigua TaxID=749465 RepID=A0ACC2ICD7_9PLEO|nr:hypothetical protein OPT61_g4894 [Boeremia exigua]
MIYSKTSEVEPSQHTDRPGWRKGTMNIGSRFDSVIHWLNNCTDNQDGTHDACLKARMPGRPSRLLDISQLELSDYVKLVSTEAYPSPCPEHTTLSHCWGPKASPRPLETTKATKSRHESGANLLSGSTVWPSYRATTKTGDAKRVRWLQSMRILFLPLLRPRQTTVKVAVTSSHGTSTLVKVQRIIAPRKALCVLKAFAIFCQAASGSEDVLALEEYAKDNQWVRDLSLVGSKAPDRWWTDRIPALAGIMDYQSIQLQDTPLLGLWRKTIAHGLSWSIANDRSVPLRPTLPKWSLVSSVGEIEGPRILEEVLFRLHLGYWTIDWTEQPYVSELKQVFPRSSPFEQKYGESVLKADPSSEENAHGVHRAIEKHLEEIFKNVLNAWNDDHWYGGGVIRQDVDTKVTWNAPIEHSNSGQITITCLLLCADTGRRTSRGDSIYFLILKRVAENVRIYTSMGLGCSCSQSSLFTSRDPHPVPQFPTPLIDLVLKTWKGSVLELR